MWRTTKDISMEIEATWADVVENLDETAGLARFAGPGGWNDADMLEVCHTTLLQVSMKDSAVEQSIWCARKECRVAKPAYRPETFKESLKSPMYGGLCCTTP